MASENDKQNLSIHELIKMEKSTSGFFFLFCLSIRLLKCCFSWQLTPDRILCLSRYTSHRNHEISHQARSLILQLRNRPLERRISWNKLKIHEFMDADINEAELRYDNVSCTIAIVLIILPLDKKR